MKIGLIEMMGHEGPSEKAATTKAVIGEWAEDACFIFAEGEEYLRILDGLRDAGAISQKSGQAGHRAYNCLDLAPLTVAREQYREMERDLDTARRLAMNSESELRASLKHRQGLHEALEAADRQYNELTAKMDEGRRLLRQTEDEREAAIRRAEEAESRLGEALGKMKEANTA